MQIVDDKLIVLKTRQPEKYEVIPKSTLLGERDGAFEVAVYWGLDEARVLRNLGVRNIPSPIVKRYDWPGRFKPMAHQQDTASFLTLHDRAFCFNEPGTGKTVSALWAADYLMRLGRVRRCLILCPLSIMQAAWMADLTSSIMHRSAVIAHHAKASRRIEMVQQDYEFVIINYDGLALIADEVRSNEKFDLVIVDEANCYKDPNTKRWKALKSILRPETRLWMMTGTPASQSPLDAYGLAKLVNPKGVPSFATAWRDQVMQKLTMFKWVAKPSAKEHVFNALQPAIRYTKEQCLDLPPVVTVSREVQLTPQQNKYYTAIKEQMLVQAAGTTISAVNAAACVSKLLQISCGAALTDNKEVVAFDASPRLAVLHGILSETERKVIVFALFRSAIDTVQNYLLEKGVGAEVIHGDVPASKRADIIKRFQNDPNPRVLVMQPQATAHGITLTAADTVVFYGPLMSVEQYVQCIARADRKGQTATSVTVVHIEGSPIEKRMFKALQTKVNDHTLIVDMFDAEVKKGVAMP